MNRKIMIPILLFFILFIKPVFASCPLCVAATGAAVATARFYGVDDLIIGTFVGGFVISIAGWINKLLKKKNKNYIPFQPIIVTIFSISLFIIIFIIAGLITFTLFDKLLMGILTGSFITLIAFRFNNFLRTSNGNKNYIPFQVIFITIAFLSITVLGYYFMGLIP